jgi:hypothetical protein
MHRIERSVEIAAPADVVWRNVTQVDIGSFRHPAYFSLLGIPKPVRAEISQPGLGGRRTAFFANGRRFSQEITAWQPPTYYEFTFDPDPGFRVAYVLDLRGGPFRMTAGAYHIVPHPGHVMLHLSSQYELHGLIGTCLGWPVKLILSLFQRYLLSGIKANAERFAAVPADGG